VDDLEVGGKHIMDVKNPKILVKVAEAAEMLSLGRSKCYAMVQAGLIPSVRIGGAVRVPVHALNAWLEGLAVDSSGQLVEEGDTLRRSA
jgi:excisionase family DNA binding protein